MASKFAISTIFKGIDKISAPVSKMNNSVQKFARGAKKGFRAANKALKKVTSRLKSATGFALKFGGLAVLAAVTAVGVALNRVAASADALAKRARRLQFPIEALQEWQFVAEQSGLSTEEFDKSIEKFTKSVGEARSGTGTLVTILKKSNPQLLRQITSAENAADAFDIYLSALRGTKNQLDKTALATAAFGKTGGKFLNITEQSTDAIKALRLEQRENGVITAEQARLAENYNDAVNSLKKSIGGLLQGALIPLLPQITRALKVFRGLIVANKEIVKVKIAKFFELIKKSIMDVVEAIKAVDRENSVFERLKTVVSAVFKVLGFLIKNSDIILEIVAGIIALKIAFLAITIVANAFAVTLSVLGFAIKAVKFAQIAFNTVMAINPFVLAILGIAALITAGILLINNWDQVKSFLLSVWNIIVEATAGSVEAIISVINRIIDDPFGAFIDAAIFYKNIWLGIISFSLKAIDKIIDFISLLINNPFAAFEQASLFLENIWSGIIATSQRAIDKIMDIIDLIKAPFEKIGKSITGLFENFGGLFGDEKKEIDLDVTKKVKTVEVKKQIDVDVNKNVNTKGKIPEESKGFLGASSDFFKSKEKVTATAIPEVKGVMQSLSDVKIETPVLPNIKIETPVLPKVEIEPPVIPKVKIETPVLPKVDLDIPTIPEIKIEQPESPEFIKPKSRVEPLAIIDIFKDTELPTINKTENKLNGVDKSGMPNGFEKFLEMTKSPEKNLPVATKQKTPEIFDIDKKLNEAGFNPKVNPVETKSNQQEETPIRQEPQVISPQIRMLDIQERREVEKSSVEVTIKDATGRAEITEKKGDLKNVVFDLENSGAF